ncbi:hypothetical protein [Parasitella parasitica]|uniref:Uncharacterized protein n=1 Tax=Parasitella parasitica TaxID=35722 RepID=A0A0B7NMM7_9FUNG|nr:hypothetical protein [Parasitella parasitica]
MRELETDDDENASSVLVKYYKPTQRSEKKQEIVKCRTKSLDSTKQDTSITLIINQQRRRQDLNSDYPCTWRADVFLPLGQPPRPDRTVTLQTRNQFDNDSACTALSCSPRIQDNCVLAARIENLNTILLVSSNGKIYPFLTASENIIKVLSDDPIGSLPTVNKAATDNLFKHTIRTSPNCRHKADQQYVEHSREITTGPSSHDFI